MSRREGSRNCSGREQQPFGLARGRGREEQRCEHERGGRALRQPDEQAQQAEGRERRNDRVRVVRRAVFDQRRRSCQCKGRTRSDGRRHHEAEDRPGAPSERDQDDGRLHVDQGWIETVDRARRERLECREQDRVLLVLHQVGGLPEDRAPDVTVDEERVGLGSPQRPAVPRIEPGRDAEAHDGDGEDCEHGERDELQHPAHDPRARRSQ